MPRGNGSGPDGMGPMTGRGAGFCAGYNMPGYANAGGYGRGGGMGMGRGGGMGRGCGGGGFGWRNMFRATGLTGWMRGGWGAPAPVAQQDELAMLKQQANYFGGELEDIQARIRELEAQKDQP